MLAFHGASGTPGKIAKTSFNSHWGSISFTRLLTHHKVTTQVHVHNTQESSAALPHMIHVHSLIDHPGCPQGLESQFLQWNLKTSQELQVHYRDN